MKLGRDGQPRSFTSVVNFRVVPDGQNYVVEGSLLQQTPYQMASATNRLHSNGLQGYGKKCNTYYWFYSEVKFLMCFNQPGRPSLYEESAHAYTWIRALVFSTKQMSSKFYIH